MGTIVIFSVWQLFQVGAMSKENKMQKIEFDLALIDLNKHTDKLFVVVGGGFPYESVRVFQNPALNSSFNMLGTGTDIGLPYYKSILNKHKITNLITALYLRKNILIIGGTEPYLQSLKQFIYDHYRVEVYFAEDKNNFTHLMPIKVIQAQ